MSKLLNRGNVFVVVRVHPTHAPSACGVFSELEDADDYRGACEQQWLDKIGNLAGVSFEIQLTTYYGK